MKNKKYLKYSANEITKFKKYNRLGRRERRIIERKINKKLGKESKIKIREKTFKKSECFNHKERRDFIKNKSLILEIIKIIRTFFPFLNSLLDKLTDKRHKGYIKYSMRALIYTRLFALICGITTMTGVSDITRFHTENCIKNISKICGQDLVELPNWQTIQDVLEEISIEEIEEIRKRIVLAIIESKMFNKNRHFGCFQVIFDATCVSSHDYNLNGTCISKKHKNKIKFYKYVLEAKLLIGNIVISLDSEWIENSEISTEKQKQDCEINAFKRMAPRIKENYPELEILITGDALYACEPVIKFCEENEWMYILNLKKKRLKQIYRDFENNLAIKNETIMTDYFLSSKIKYKGSNLSAVRYQEIKKGETVSFNYITNLTVTNYNIMSVVSVGRKRWKIENEGFNEQKNGVFCISHLCSRNENAIKIHYFFIQIAHLIRQLLEQGSEVLRSMKLKTKKEVSSLLLKSLTSTPIDTNLNKFDFNFHSRFDE